MHYGGGLPKLNLHLTKVAKPVENLEDDDDGASKRLFMEDLDKEKVR
jgi:hypothetical protein